MVGYITIFTDNNTQNIMANNCADAGAVDAPHHSVISQFRWISLINWAHNFCFVQHRCLNSLGKYSLELSMYNIIHVPWYVVVSSGGRNMTWRWIATCVATAIYSPLSVYCTWMSVQVHFGRIHFRPRNFNPATRVACDLLENMSK